MEGVPGRGEGGVSGGGGLERGSKIQGWGWGA